MVHSRHEILVLPPPLAEETLLVRALRADVIEADTRFLVAVSAPVDRLQKSPGRFHEGGNPGGVLRKESVGPWE